MSVRPILDADLVRLTIPQLLALYDAHAAAMEGYRAVQAQPRAEGKAYAIIDALGDRCTGEMQRIADHVVTRSPADRTEREAKGELLVQWNLACGGWRDLVAAVRENFEPGLRGEVR
ncbi:hypothetical protein [Enterovirga rhinocerotis]|uniref:hypothetical protein n=1 Tax=Enterovirga rhinocerotis TaxID=1339210 RepID=UPI001060477F|nr:hypothetical protein [Enterovirga rhinocerotis]